MPYSFFARRDEVCTYTYLEDHCSSGQKKLYIHFICLASANVNHTDTNTVMCVCVCEIAKVRKRDKWRFARCEIRCVLFIHVAHTNAMLPEIRYTAPFILLSTYKIDNNEECLTQLGTCKRCYNQC